MFSPEFAACSRHGSTTSRFRRISWRVRASSARGWSGARSTDAASVLGNWSRRLRSWAVDDALPFWATAGFDGSNGRFEERLAFSGEPIPRRRIRLMVQARQIYVYATAARLGWYPRSAATGGARLRSMVRDFQAADGQGRLGLLDRSRRHRRRRPAGTLRPRLRALAVASYVQMTGQSATLALADETLAFIDANMRAHREGYVERLPADGWPSAAESAHASARRPPGPVERLRRTRDTSNGPGMSSTCSSRNSSSRLRNAVRVPRRRAAAGERHRRGDRRARPSLRMDLAAAMVRAGDRPSRSGAMSTRFMPMRPTMASMPMA